MEYINELNKKFKKEIQLNQLFKAQEEKAKRWSEEEKKHDIRNKFQRDRDRILYSRAFRRLSGKTQVFRTGNDDHVRTRLTHTLEVSQIARTISKELGLDEDLTEAIALGHDLGHTPFGHVGERTLNHIMNGCFVISDFNIEISKSKGERGFKHNLQGARVVNELEENPLNLTRETIWGIINHSSLEYKNCEKEGIINCDVKHKNDNNKNCEKKHELDFYNYINEDINDSENWTLEAYVVAKADEIAQRHHDIEDAIEFKILSTGNLAKTIEDSFKDCNRYDNYKEVIDRLKIEKDKYKANSDFSRFIVDFLTTDLINESKKNLLEKKEDFKMKSKKEFYSDTKSLIEFSENVKEGDIKLQKFLKNRILKSYEAQRMDGLGSYVITKLFEAYIHNPQQLRDKTIKKLYENILKNKKKLEELENGDTNLINDIKNEQVNDNGYIRNVISKFHYLVIDSNTEIEKIYKQLLLRTICDYIAGMTDNYAINEHKELYNKS